MSRKTKITPEALVFNIQGFSVHDGPGIRTTVFLKGCSLSCWWCANPESQNPKLEIGFISPRCNECRKCISACVDGAITSNVEGALYIDRSRCTLCGKCLEVCYPGALTIYGQGMNCEDILKIVEKDKSFYQNSGGGVTLSGGEPLMQPSFTFSFFKACRELEIHSCLDTSGYGDTKELRKIIKVVDMVLFDIKHMNPRIHHKYTGRDNKLILENAEVVASSGVHVVFRFPLIPGVNDAVENIKETSAFLKELGGNHFVEILPYHRLGKSKYQALGQPYLMEGTEPPTKEYVQRVQKTFESLGVRAKIVR